MTTFNYLPKNYLGAFGLDWRRLTQSVRKLVDNFARRRNLRIGNGGRLLSFLTTRYFRDCHRSFSDIQFIQAPSLIERKALAQCWSLSVAMPSNVNIFSGNNSHHILWDWGTLQICKIAERSVTLV